MPRPSQADSDVTLVCHLVGREAVKVKVRYLERTMWRTVGTLHLTASRLTALVATLRRGGAHVQLDGSYIAQHPELAREGRR